MNRICVNIACGSSYIEGWLNYDYAPASPAVTKANLLGKLPLGDDTVDVLYSSHFLEHIPRNRIAGFLAECFRIMKPGGQIRLALPDLEELCQEYLRQRDARDHAKADFVVLEMLDQCVRREPGGELGKCYQELSRNGSKSMIDYVSARTGEELSNIPDAISKSDLDRVIGVLRHPARIWGRLERLYCRTLTSLLPSAFVQQNVSFANVGERHAWIYDFRSVSSLLEHAGFVAVRKMAYDRSEIVDFPFYPLDVNNSGLPRKGLGSMYIEAIKP